MHTQLHTHTCGSQYSDGGAGTRTLAHKLVRSHARTCCADSVVCLASTYITARTSPKPAVCYISTAGQPRPTVTSAERDTDTRSRKLTHVCEQRGGIGAGHRHSLTRAHVCEATRRNACATCGVMPDSRCPATRAASSSTAAAVREVSSTGAAFSQFSSPGTTLIALP